MGTERRYRLPGEFIFLLEGIDNHWHRIGPDVKAKENHIETVDIFGQINGELRQEMLRIKLPFAFFSIFPGIFIEDDPFYFCMITGF